MTIINGYVKTDPSHRVPRGAATFGLAALIVCAILAPSLRSRTLGIVDRLALLAFLVSLGFSIADFPSVLGFTLMFASLLVAWAYNRFYR